MIKIPRASAGSLAALALALGNSAAHASDDLTLAPAPIALDTAAAYAQPPAADPGITQPRWGHADDHWWLTLGGGVAHDLHEDTDYNLHVAFSTFIARELEFAVELGGWYFAQDGEDTGGVNPNMVFRWHFLHDDAFDWTIYGDVGIGLLFAFDDVPNGGTSFGFTPRAGVGFTRRIEGDTRLQVGFRYHHISNGRFQGDARNPSRDSIMLYAGIVFPF